MKNTWRILNVALVLLAAAALSFAGYRYFLLQDMDPADYTRQAADLRSQAETVREDAARLSREIREREADVSADVSALGEEGAALQQQLEELRTRKEDTNARLETLAQEAEDAARIRDRVMEVRSEYAGKIRQLEDKIVAGESDVKICYWTLDDGPSYYTQQFVDAAKELGVYLTFFSSREANSSAKNDDPEVERELLRQEAMGGHSIQNHTNSHQYAKYGNLYGMGIESFREQVKLQHDWVLECTGIEPDVFRFPGGSAHAFALQSKDEMLSVLDEMGYVWIDWSCDIFDNAKAMPTVKEEAANAVYEVKTLDIAVLLSHDWNGNTLEAFKRAVPQLQEMGYVFLPLFAESWTIGNTEIIFS